MKVDLGFFTMPVHPKEKNYTLSINEDYEAILLADRLGYTEAFVGEHVADIMEPIPSSLTFLASLAKTTNSIRLGTGTVNLSNNHPAHIATQAAMLDHLLEGRLLLGIGPGSLESDAEVFGNLGQNRTEMFVEAIEHILAIWTGNPPFELKGKYWNISTVRTHMPDIGQGEFVRPFQVPHPPIFATAIMPNAPGLRAAAARGWLPISGDFLQPQYLAGHWSSYGSGLTSVSEGNGRQNWRVARTIFVGEDAQSVERYTRGSTSPYRHRYEQMINRLRGSGRFAFFKQDQDMPNEEVTADYLLDTLMIAGTVEDVAKQILDLHTQTGGFGTLLYTGHDWADSALGKRSMVLMAEKVLPLVNQELARRH